MLSRKQRLRREDVIRVISRGDSRHFPSFSLKYERSHRPYHRFGVVVSKKVAKSAVERNKLRRMFYEILSEFAKKDGRGMDAIIQVKINSNTALLKDSAQLVEFFQGLNKLLP